MLSLHQPSFNDLPLSVPFRFNNVLENSDHFLVEVKKTEPDFLSDFVWLKISKDHKQIGKLQLKAKDSAYHIEERFFEEGYLKFNDNDGIFIEKFNALQHKYQIRNIATAISFIPTLTKFFSKNNPLNS